MVFLPLLKLLIAHSATLGYRMEEAAHPATFITDWRVRKSKNRQELVKRINELLTRKERRLGIPAPEQIQKRE